MSAADWTCSECGDKTAGTDFCERCGAAERLKRNPELLPLLCMAVYNVWSATLIGNAPPFIRCLNERMRTPRIGDLVIETSTIWHRDRDEARFGRLVRIERKPCFTDEQWAEELASCARYGTEPEERPTEPAWVLLRPDGSEYTWVNASFIVVLTEIFSHDFLKRARLGTEAGKTKESE